MAVMGACPKCRGGYISRRYVPASGSRKECLEHECAGCGYTWREACADAPWKKDRSEAKEGP